MQESEALFNRWYVQPLMVLKSLPNGDGAFIALATSCFLYERYITAVTRNSPGKNKATKDAKVSRLAMDFEVDNQTAKHFWEVIRDGLLHNAMPKQLEHGKQILPQWVFRGDFPRPIELLEFEGKQLIRVQPWLFMDRVISLWQENIDLLEANDSFPWGSISQLPF